MIIQVVGSCRSINDAVTKERFKEAGKALGAALAKRGHTIAVGIQNWQYPMCETMSEYIIQGANTVSPTNGKKHNIIFFGPLTPEPLNTTTEIDSFQEFKKLSNIDLHMKPIPGSSLNYGANLIPNLNEVDAVILVCGAEGTASIGFAARALNKPLLTVNSLGGTAEAMYRDILGEELNQLQEQKKILDASVLNVPWATNTEMGNDNGKKEEQANNAEAIVKLAERLIKVYTQENRSTKTAQTISIILGPILVIGWLIVYALAATNKINLTYAFFGLLYIASLIGASLHTLIAQRDETTILTIQGFITDAALSILLAFGLALFYLIGGISFTGNVVVLNTENSTFQNIALSMSVVGLAAGTVTPIRELTDRLSNVVSPKDKGA